MINKTIAQKSAIVIRLEFVVVDPVLASPYPRRPIVSELERSRRAQLAKPRVFLSCVFMGRSSLVMGLLDTKFSYICIKHQLFTGNQMDVQKISITFQFFCGTPSTRICLLSRVDQIVGKSLPLRTNSVH